MRIPPAAVLATWPMPDYVNPQTRGPSGTITVLVLTSLVTVVLGIRVYTRKVISKSFGVDDVLVCIAYIPAMAFAVAGIAAEFYLGWDRHLWDLKYNQIIPGLQLSIATFNLFNISSNLTKLSTLAMLYKLVESTKLRMKVCVKLLIGVVIISTTIFSSITIFQCNPISDYWTFSDKPQNCIDEAAHLLAAGVINVITDFVVVLLPIKTVAGLNLPKTQHMVLIGLFCAGFGAAVAGIVRTYYTWLLTVNYDRTWYGWSAWVSSAIELYVGIASHPSPTTDFLLRRLNRTMLTHGLAPAPQICASVPSMKKFFTLYLPGILGSSSSFTTRRSTAADSHGKTCNSDSSRSSKIRVARRCSRHPAPRSSAEQGLVLVDLERVATPGGDAEPAAERDLCLVSVSPR